MNTSEKKLVLIDGNAIIHRAYHAMPHLTTPKGDAIGAVQGFLNILLRIITDIKPTHIAVAWDRKEPTFRHKAFKDYQIQRPETDKELISQFSKVRQVLEVFDIAFFDKAGFEADDIIGTFAHKAQKHFEEIIIVTGDKDQLQLVNTKTKVYMPAKGVSVGVVLGEKEVYEKLGVRPDQVVDLKAFMGDQSDNYPGVFGIGPKTAQTLLKKYDTYPKTYKHLDELPESVREKLINGKDGGDISYKLARIVNDVDVDFKPDDLNVWSVGNNKTLQLFDEYGFRTLTKRVKEVGAKMVGEKQQKLF
ncbi:hypothetical protein IPM62_01125 [Candidatus Woesebacteria bacterium]|nr:MAG: hypothetical protein IPM62_01125 [Candidatus Woesebacteria bacterium]